MGQEENIKELKEKINQLSKENENLKKKNNELLAYSKNLEKTIEEISNNNNKEIIDKYLKLKNENESLINKIKILEQNPIENGTSTNSQYKVLNLKLTDELKNERDKNVDLNKKVEDIKKTEELFEKYKKTDYNEEYIGKQLENFYDVVINIKSISSLLKPEGWQIKWNKNRRKICDKIKDKKLFKIGVLGNGNIGKSFLLSRLFKENIPSGYSVITEGLSIKYNEEKGYTILDSAGLQTPLIKADNYVQLIPHKNKKIEGENENEFKEYENLYKDKTQTENFIQNLILYLSDMLLIVVGKLSFNEQRLINKIKKQIELGQKNEEKKKQIFIIHNLSNFQKKSQVEEHINNTLLKSASFKLEQYKDIIQSKKENKERYYFVENETEFQVYHLIMAREGTEAGDYYNQYTYEFLEEKFNNFTERKPLSILDEVKDRFIEWSNDLLEERIEPENIEIIKENQNDLEKQYIFKTNKERHVITPKACISDELGFSIYRSNGYEPPYNYYIENDNYLSLKLEIPGNVKIEDAYASLDTKEIIIVGNKEDDTNSIKAMKNTRKFGKFNMHIPFPNQIKISDEEPMNSEEFKEEYSKCQSTGIYLYKFKLAKRRQRNL